MQTLYPLSSQLLPHHPPLPFSSFLPSLTSIPHFLSPYSATLSRLLSQGLYWSKGKKAQQQQLAALFSRAGIEGLGALCMSEPHSSGSIQLCFCLRYSPRPYFVRSKGARRKRRDHPFSLFVLHIAIQALPKPPLMSWPRQRCECGEKKVCEREKVWLIWVHSLHWWNVTLVFISLLGGFPLKVHLCCVCLLQNI